MAPARSDTRTRIVALSAVLELATGVALIAVPGVVVTLLLAPPASPMVGVVARIAGIALVALGLSCWPGRQAAGDAAVRGLLVYNALAAAWLAYLGADQQASGWLLWPTVALHAVVASLLLYFRTAAR